ncbi:hypothetical protein [Clostridium transplantifaecale]|uniref:hypothetical protein n=1 Tax=Clostridium transplantifaecale TaxID=2479838 RepID=UPI000F64001A|nr:hypothetical protein [Clostridium transplantifaecale]
MKRDSNVKPRYIAFIEEYISKNNTTDKQEILDAAKEHFIPKKKDSSKNDSTESDSSESENNDERSDRQIRRYIQEVLDNKPIRKRMNVNKKNYDEIIYFTVKEDFVGIFLASELNKSFNINSFYCTYTQGLLTCHYKKKDCSSKDIGTTLNVLLELYYNHIL